MAGEGAPARLVSPNEGIATIFGEDKLAPNKKCNRQRLSNDAKVNAGKQLLRRGIEEFSAEDALRHELADVRATFLRLSPRQEQGLQQPPPARRRTEHGEGAAGSGAVEEDAVEGVRKRGGDGGGGFAAALLHNVWPSTMCVPFASRG